MSREKLESLLELALRSSSLVSEKYLDDITCMLHTYTLTEQLFAYQNISMNPASSSMMMVNNDALNNSNTGTFGTGGSGLMGEGNNGMGNV